MFERQRGQVSVGGEIAGGAEGFEQAEQNLRVPGARVPARLGHRQRIGEDVPLGGESDEPKNPCPREADRSGAVQ